LPSVHPRSALNALAPLVLALAALGGCEAILGTGSLGDRSAADDAGADSTTGDGSGSSSGAGSSSGSSSGSDSGSGSGSGSGSSSGSGSGGGSGSSSGGADAGKDSGDGGATTFCDGGAVDLQTDPSNCGACGHVCAGSSLPHTAATCAAGVCGTGCATGWGDCDPDAGQGCTFSLGGDPNNCGACGNVCGNANTTSAPTCSSTGQCVFQCAAGTAHCGATDATGCETTIETDPNNCGQCGYACGGTVACTGYVCRLTNGTDTIAIPSLLTDGTSLYWATDPGGSTPSAMRGIGKDGTNLRTITPTGDLNGPGSTGGPSLALDANNFYYYIADYASEIFALNKLGTQDAQQVAFKAVGAEGFAVLTDGDATHAATNVYFSQTLNGPGVYRVPVGGAANPTNIWGAADCGDMFLLGTTMYFATAQDTVLDFDITQTTPVVKNFASFTQMPNGMGSDGTNLYVEGGDANLYAVNLTTQNKTTLATGGGSVGALAVDADGGYVYVATDNNLYRVPLSGGGGSFPSYLYVSVGQLPNTSGIMAVVVDATSVYFMNQADVYKVHK